LIFDDDLRFQSLDTDFDFRTSFVHAPAQPRTMAWKSKVPDEPTSRGASQTIDNGQPFGRDSESSQVGYSQEYTKNKPQVGDGLLWIPHCI